MRILLMDDEEMVRTVTRKMLEFLGHEVTVAADGAAAVAAYRKSMESGQEFDIVILDILVESGIGGAQALASLREIAPHVAAVATSGFCDDASIEGYMRHGFRWFLPKPVTLEELQTVLLDICRKLRKRR